MKRPNLLALHLAVLDTVSVQDDLSNVEFKLRAHEPHDDYKAVLFEPQPPHPNSRAGRRAAKRWKK